MENNTICIKNERDLLFFVGICKMLTTDCAKVHSMRYNPANSLFIRFLFNICSLQAQAENNPVDIIRSYSLRLDKTPADPQKT